MPPEPRPTKRPPLPSRGGGVQRRTLVLVLAGAALVAALAIVLSVVLAGGNGSTAAPASVVTDVADLSGIPQHGLVLGNPLARVTLTQYVDTSCPVCKDYEAGTFPALAREYVRAGTVKIETRLLDFVGPSSPRGRALVLAAARQDRAYQLLELLYANQGDERTDWLTDDLARALARHVPGLDAERLLADAARAAVRREGARFDAQAAGDGVQGTPTFVLTTPDGVRHLLGAGSPGVEPFRRALDRALAG